MKNKGEEKKTIRNAEEKDNYVIDPVLHDNEFLQFFRNHITMTLDEAYQLYVMEIEQGYIDEHLKKRTVWQTTDGKWRTRVTDPNGKVRQIERKKKEDLMQAIIDHYKNYDTRPTVGKVFYEWMDERLDYKEIQKGTFDRTINDFKRFFVRSGFDKYYIESVAEDDLTHFIRIEIRDEELTSKGWAKLKGLIFGLFAYAKTKHYTDLSISSYLSDLHLPRNCFRKHVVDEKSQVFTDEEVHMIVKWITSSPERMASLTNLGILLTFYTGLRAGELSALKASDFDGNILTVRRTEIRYKGTKEYDFEVRDATKGRDGIRTIVVPDECLEIVKRVKRVNPKAKYLFTDTDGHRVKGARFSEKLKRICNYIDIQPRSLHKIRKTYASILLDHGCTDRLVTNQMGHTDIRTTLGHYYYDRHNEEENINIINAAFSEFAKDAR